MKARESGMPEETMWQGFFDPPAILAKMGLTPQCGKAVDFGCGYGTFAIPRCRQVRERFFPRGRQEREKEGIRRGPPQAVRTTPLPPSAS